MKAILICVVLATVHCARADIGESDATLEKRLQKVGEVRAIAQENAKRVSVDQNTPANLKQRIEAILPASLSSQDLFAFAILFELAQSGAAEDHRYDNVFGEASHRCAWLLIDRRDGLYWLKRLKPICGSDGGNSELYRDYIAAAEKKDWRNAGH